MECYWYKSMAYLHDTQHTHTHTSDDRSFVRSFIRWLASFASLLVMENGRWWSQMMMTTMMMVMMIIPEQSSARQPTNTYEWKRTERIRAQPIVLLSLYTFACEHVLIRKNFKFINISPVRKSEDEQRQFNIHSHRIAWLTHSLESRNFLFPWAIHHSFSAVVWRNIVRMWVMMANGWMKWMTDNKQVNTMDFSFISQFHISIIRTKRNVRNEIRLWLLVWGNCWEQKHQWLCWHMQQSRNNSYLIDQKIMADDVE